MAIRVAVRAYQITYDASGPIRSAVILRKAEHNPIRHEMLYKVKHQKRKLPVQYDQAEGRSFKYAVGSRNMGRVYVGSRSRKA